MNTVYETYYKSSPNDLIECKRIRLFIWTKYPNLNISNLDEVLELASSDSDIKIYDSIRDSIDEDVPFKFEEFDQENPMIFNVIVYLSKYNQSLGYTRFNNIQDTTGINRLNIYLKFRFDYEEFEVILENNLSTHMQTRFTGNLDIFSTYDEDLFTTKKMILDRYIDSYTRYTNDLNHIINDSSSKLICGIDYFSINSINRLHINEIELTYSDNVSVGMYERDIVAYEWNKRNYKVTSLIRRNKNNTPVIYYQGDVSDVYTGTVEIKRLVSNYLICESVDTRIENTIFNIESKKSRLKDKNINFISNPYLERSGYLINNSDEVETLLERFTNEELRRYVKSTLLFSYSLTAGLFIDFIGSFVVLENGDDLIYSNLEGIIYLKKKSKNFINVINDNCILDQSGDSFKFYFTDGGSVVYSDEFNVNKVDRTKPDFLHLKIVVEKGLMYSQVFDGFRKNPISYEYIPNIKCSFAGLLFYQVGSKLKLL